METKYTIRPAEGLLVRGPTGLRIPQEGTTVANTSYWRRKILSREVIIVEAEAPKLDPKRTKKDV